MANNVTPTEERRAIRLAQINRICEICGGHYDQTPNGRWCGNDCRLRGDDLSAQNADARDPIETIGERQ